MNNEQSSKPASAVAVISQRLASLGVFPSAPGEAPAELFKAAGVCFASSAANVVGSLASGKLSGAQKRRAAAEAVKMAAVADACMAHAAYCANPHRRQTGRTTRMLEHAIELARAGRAVYVVAEGMDEVDRLRAKAAQLAGDKTALGISFESRHAFHELDWREMRMVRAHPNCVVLVDHFAIETHFAVPEKVIAMQHAYDAPRGAGKEGV